MANLKVIHLFLPVFQLLSLITAQRGAFSCKAFLGSQDWPSECAWSALNESIAGRLLQPPPPGAVCHPSEPTYNSSMCSAVQLEWLTTVFHQSNPISNYWNNFNNDTCLPNPLAPCASEGYPVYVINATSADHVKKGVDFARENNIRLVVKSTGHDYIGR